jgi:uncharacterized membrane protein YciS (DUF1049 family)
MIVIVGLVILVAAVIVAVAGVLTNGGSGHGFPHDFAVLGYHVTGSTGTLFLYGIVVGAVGLFGLSLLLAGARRTSRRGSAARRGLKQSRQETATVSQTRDDLIDQRDTARAYTASQLASEAAGDTGSDLSPGSHRRSKSGLFGRRPATEQATAEQATAEQPGSPAGQPGPDVHIPASAPAISATNGSRP